MTNPPDGLKTSAVVTLGLIALTSGVFSGLAAWSVCLLLHWGSQLMVDLTVGVLVTLASWADLVGWWRRLLAHEHGVDPQPPPTDIKMLRVEVAQGNQLVYTDLPLSESALRTFASEVLAGASLTESAWLGRSDGMFSSRAHFVKFRDACVRRGWFSWISGHSQGLVISPTGRAVMRYLANCPVERGGERGTYDRTNRTD
jgi:hypothetical protein